MCLFKTFYLRVFFIFQLLFSRYIQLETLRFMCFYGNQDCIDQAKLYYQNGVDEGTSSLTLKNFKTIIYETVIRYGTDEFWQEFYQKAMQTESSSERLMMLHALTASRNENYLKRYLK